MTDDSYSSTHPPLPPTTEDDRISWLRLLRSRRVGVATFWRMMADHGSAQAALAALPDVARKAGLSEYSPCSEQAAVAEMRLAARHRARMVCRGAPDYPIDLEALGDAPPILWVRGAVQALHQPMIALVGARNASSLGGRMARSLAIELGKAGFTISSGLARGIDAAAHHAALDVGTVAVLAGGVDVIYPTENAALAEAILDHGGALISEQPMGCQPMARHFPTRNRIVSGMSRAVVVVEAAARSGSLITARTALDQGREVLAVPGHPLDPRAAGCNLLIREGARLVRRAEDVLEALSEFDGAHEQLPDLPSLEDAPGNTAGHTTGHAAAPKAGVPAAPMPERVVSWRGMPDTSGYDRLQSPGAAQAPCAQTAQANSPKRAAPEADSHLRQAAALHREILARLGPSPLAEDQLVRDLGVAPGRLAPALTDLELSGAIERAPGGLLSRPPEGGTRR